MALAYQLKNEYSKARSACYDALKLNPNFGNAYILIGKLYSWSSSQCSRNNELLNATSWAAADKFNRAIAVDPSCASEARSELSKLKYPEESEKHMRGYES
ncbi:hypothetical protein LJC37_05345 [Bacteroidales bacterium OttesenSCG-928-E04]|nr:hypothetical protein [Bacteroidales bacterium OttesenSCG-928-E04]